MQHNLSDYSDSSDTNSDSSDTSSQHSTSEDEKFYSQHSKACARVLKTFNKNFKMVKVTNNDLMEAINRNNEEVTKLREEIGTLKTQLSTAFNTIKKLEEENIELRQDLRRQDDRIARQDDRIAQQDDKIAQLEREKERNANDLRKIAAIEKRQDVVERQNNQNKLIIRGSAFSYDADNIKTATIDTIAEKLQLSKEHLKNAEYRLYGKNNTSILMTVNNDNDKNAMFTAARTMKPKDISINEFLTPAKAKLMYELRKIKFEEKKFNSVFSLSGNVYVTYTQGGDKKLINNLRDA